MCNVYFQQDSRTLEKEPLVPLQLQQELPPFAHELFEQASCDDAAALSSASAPNSPSHHDVLLGRGVATNRHPGNENFRNIVATRVASYVTSTKKEKMAITRSIVLEVLPALSPPGRFLEKYGATGLYREVELKRALEKTAQALRDGAAPLRRRMAEDLDGMFSSSSPNKECVGTKMAFASKRASPSLVLDSVPSNKRAKISQSVSPMPPVLANRQLSEVLAYATSQQMAALESGSLRSQPSPTMSNDSSYTNNFNNGTVLSNDFMGLCTTQLQQQSQSSQQVVVKAPQRCSPSPLTQETSSAQACANDSAECSTDYNTNYSTQEMISCGDAMNACVNSNAEYNTNYPSHLPFPEGYSANNCTTNNNTTSPNCDPDDHFAEDVLAAAGIDLFSDMFAPERIFQPEDDDFRREMGADEDFFGIGGSESLCELDLGAFDDF